MNTERLVISSRVIVTWAECDANSTYCSSIAGKTFITSIPVEGITEYQAALFIWNYCPPVLVLWGVFGNLATIAVLTRSNWRGSTLHHHLIGLLVVDTCLLLTGLLRQWLMFTFSVDVRNYHWLVCKLHIFLTYSAGTMSPWLLVAVTAQRTVAVTWPHRVNFLCSPRRRKVVLANVVLISCVFNAHLLFGMELNPLCDTSAYYAQFANFIHPWIDMSISSLLPSLILGLCNVILIFKVRDSVQHARTLFVNLANQKKIVSSMTLTLIVASATFLALTLPISVYLIWYSFVLEDSTETEVALVASSELASAIVFMLWYFNSAANFLLYCASGNRFRREFRNWVCGARKVAS